MDIKNVFQDGTSGVEIFSPSGTNPFKNASIYNPSSIQREYDRSTKGYIVTIVSKDRSSTKIQFPKNTTGQSLGLIQRFLCFQLFLFENDQFSLELTITDSKNCRRRVSFSTAQKNVNVNNLHCLFPLPKNEQYINTWLTLVIDMKTIMQYDSDSSLSWKSIDSIVIYANCKLRKIFSLPAVAVSGTSESPSFAIPPTFQYPSGVESSLWYVPPPVMMATSSGSKNEKLIQSKESTQIPIAKTTTIANSKKSAATIQPRSQPKNGTNPIDIVVTPAPVTEVISIPSKVLSCLTKSTIMSNKEKAKLEMKLLKLIEYLKQLEVEVENI